jgi:hypothetical protein
VVHVADRDAHGVALDAAEAQQNSDETMRYILRLADAVAVTTSVELAWEP